MIGLPAQPSGDAGTNIVAGVAAAIAATVILGTAKWIHGRHLQARDIKHVRGILLAGRKRVMESQDVFNDGMDATLPADALRCAQYNLMIKQLAIALDHTTSNLPYAKRQQIFEALDWYHTGSLLATKDANGQPVFVIPQEGVWPTTQMNLTAAINRFTKLEAIRWLKLRPRR